MKPWYALPAVLSLASLGVSLALAPFAFPMLGQSVYQWPDARITALEVLSMASILFFAATLKRPRLLRLTAAACAVFAGFNFILFVVFNYGTNAPDGILPALFSAQAAMTAESVMDGLRLSPVYGLALQTIAWFIAMVASVFSLRLSRGFRPAVFDALLFASLVLALYALGVYLVIPQWSSRAVIGLQSGTVFAWFTNDDLLVLASAASLAFAAVRLRWKPSSQA